MKESIQVSTYKGNNPKYENVEFITRSSLHDIKSLDEYDINVIDLSDQDIWAYKENSRNSLDNIADLVSISKMIENRTKAKIVILLPQNLNYKYYVDYNGKYRASCELKDMLNYLKGILGNLSKLFKVIDLEYENTQTQIEAETYKAAFYFNNENGLIVSDLSEKSVAIKMDEIYVSTLNIENSNQLMVLLRKLQLIENRQDIPEWFNEIEMFDDHTLYDQIRKAQDIIGKETEKINVSQSRIEENNHLKSILYTNGDELVTVVFEILEEILGCDLSKFEDIKKEDFLVECGDKIFIGEIKGINTNVKNANISQLDNHYYNYLDSCPDAKESLKALLIINHQKSKALNTREPVMSEQISLAERNGSLIIETHSLLKLLEMYRQGEMNSNEIRDLLFEKTGVLVI